MEVQKLKEGIFIKMASNFNRLKISEDATKMLATLKTRTSLTPNILCRIALSYALSKSKVSNLVPIKEDGQEFVRFILLGEYDIVYTSLVKEKCVELNLDPEKDFLKVFKNYLNDGIITLYARVKGIEDIVNLIEEK